MTCALLCHKKLLVKVTINVYGSRKVLFQKMFTEEEEQQCLFIEKVMEKDFWMRWQC